MSEIITIIVPIYKVEKYLKKCVDSILRQTYENLEIILVDDGSPDGCAKICDEYKTLDSRIMVIHQKNAGLSAARNAGLDLATGSYIMFVDGDDYIEPEMCEILYRRLKEEQSDLAVCSVKCRDEHDGEIWTDRFVQNGLPNEWITSRQALERVDNNWLYVIACNKLYKKKLFDDYRFPVGKVHEDEFAVHRIFAQCQSISVAEDRLYNYLQRNGSITKSSSFTVKRLDAVDALMDRYAFLKKREYVDLSKKALSGASWVLCDYLLKLPEKSLKKTAKNHVRAVMKELVRNMNVRAVKLWLVYIVA